MGDSFFCGIITVNHELPHTKALCSQSGRWTGSCQRNERLTGGAELLPRDFSTPRFSSSPCPASSEPNPRSHHKQISIFSSERLWISFWCQSWRYAAGMSYIHLIVSFIVVRECVGAHSQITRAQFSESDLSVWRRQAKSYMSFACARGTKKKKKKTWSIALGDFRACSSAHRTELPTHTATKRGKEK